MDRGLGYQITMTQKAIKKIKIYEQKYFRLKHKFQREDKSSSMC